MKVTDLLQFIVARTRLWLSLSCRPTPLTTLVALAAVMALTPVARGGDDDGHARVMTQNMHQGTNFSEILAATTPAQFVAAVTVTYQNILATKPAVRAAALAREIARERPDLVALQEAAMLRTGTGAPTVPATTVEVDQLALLLAELENLGHRYNAVAIVPNIDAQAPSTLGFNVRLTDRTAILVKADRGSDDIRLSNMQVQEYLALLSFPTPLGISIPNTRGWASVDVRVKGRGFRFVTTHLEGIQPYNLAQTAEALQSAIATTTLPIVFVGDFNILADVPSDATYASYQAMISAGLIDAWKQKRPFDPGLTCCQNQNVMNVTTNLTQRVDLIMLRGAIQTRDIHLVGDATADMTGGVWPSDHAGIIATVRLSGSSSD